MNPRCGPAACLVMLGIGAACAQDVPPPPRLASLPATAAPAAAVPAAPAAPARAAGRPTAAAHLRVVEDDEVRIEEVRGPRGQLQRVTVHSKVPGRRAYEILVPPGGKDASQARGATGQSAWSLFDF